MARAPFLVVLTGAGVSAESGLATFRDRGGLWAKYDPYELATPEAFARDPERVHEFYNLRRRSVIEARPSSAHEALARLERELPARGGRLTLVTQNVDDLHERAGSRSPIHMHGELLKARCVGCERVVAWREDLSPAVPCPGCRRAGGLRPHVVWFGEVPFHLDAIADALAAADLFVAVGTSGAVYPAAGFVDLAREQGTPTLELNLAPSDGASRFHEGRYGPAGEIVPAWVEELLG